jgi:ribosomal protein S18 acetylase RimI-like enzyme
VPSEVIDIRQFTARDFEPLLMAESRVWDAELRWDYSASRHLISSCLDRKELSGYALLSEGRITGYSFFFYEGEKGLIGNLFVAPNGERLEQARVLLEHVIETLLATPGLQRIETQLAHFACEELEPCFHAHGFEGYLRRFMALSLADRQAASAGADAAKSPSAPGPARCPEAFRIEPWERRHDHAAAELVYATYRYHVDARINGQYTSLAGATRLIENIVHQRGCGDLLPQASLVVVHRPTDQLAGVLALTAVRPRTAHIPQVAVASEFQGAGLGTAMMETSFQELARQGYQEVSLTVTDLNGDAVRLYERLGFDTFRTFGAFVWEQR